MIKQLLIIIVLPMFASQSSPLTFSTGIKNIPATRFTTNCITMHFNGQAVGDITWSKLNDNDVTIDTLYILPSYRNRGFAQSLLMYALSQFSKTFKKAVLQPYPFERIPCRLSGHIDTHPEYFTALAKLRRFYERHGFQAIPEKKFMVCTLLPREQALTPATLATTMKTIAGTLA